MEVSSQSNNYQMMNAYQMQNSSKPENSIQPVPNPSEPKLSNQELYEVSDGNLIRGEDNEVQLTPQGQNNVSEVKDENSAEQEAATQAERDAQRENAANYVHHQSKKSQVEIYLAVASDGKVELGDDATPSILESLRDVQKQNNAVEAYATYAENQQGGKAAFF